MEATKRRMTALEYLIVAAIIALAALLTPWLSAP